MLAEKKKAAPLTDSQSSPESESDFEIEQPKGEKEKEKRKKDEEIIDDEFTSSSSLSSVIEESDYDSEIANSMSSDNEFDMDFNKSKKKL